MTHSAKIEWQGVSKRFEGAPILDGLNLHLKAGQSLVIIGASGQGKSVTIKVALGLLPIDDGQVLFDGKDLATLSEAKRRDMFLRMGVLFQGAALFDSLRVWENVAFRLINADGVPRARARQKAVHALAQVSLDETVADLYPSELSGGMQKRVGLARAVVADPDVLFFDEPTTGLDPITGAAINALIVQQVRGLGRSAISITHDLTSARTVGDEIAMLHSGRIVWRGTPLDLDRTDNPFVRRFVDAQTFI